MHAKFELFITFRYPQNGHFYHAFLRKSKKRGSKLDQKGVKRGEKGRLGLKLLNTWLESLEKMLHAKFQLFITFGYQKNGNFYPDFFTKINIFEFLTFRN